MTRISLVNLGVRRTPLSTFRLFHSTSKALNSKLSKPQDKSHGHAHSHSGGLTHSHSHHHNNILLTEKGGWRNPAIRITWVGLFTNIAMAAGKGIGGVVFHSPALVADSVHALSDLVSDFLTLATVSIGMRPASPAFPNGMGKVETLGSIGVSALLVGAGVSMAYGGMVSAINTSGIMDAVGPQLQEILAVVAHSHGGHSHSHSHIHGAHDVTDQGSAAAIAAVSVVIKEWVYQATMRVAKKTGSTVLVANAWHHRVDSLVSAVALVTISAGYFCHVAWLDPVGAILVSGVVAKAGWGTAKTAVMELTDAAVPVQGEEHVNKLQQAQEAIKVIQQSTNEDLFYVKNVNVMSSGPNFIMSIIIDAKPSQSISSISLSDFERVADALKDHLQAEDPKIKRVMITWRGLDSALQL